MITIKNLKKSFGDLKAVDDLSFEIKEGEIFGVIGQNGAGKSTLFRCIMDFYDEYSGEVLYNGIPLKTVPLEKIGFLPEERSLEPKVTIKDEIKYFAKLNLMKDINDQTIEEWFNRFEVKGKLTDKIKDLSKGNQQKVQLLCALIYSPEFVILDEPFSGLDPYNISLLEKIIREINKEGTTIMFSSHNMANVENLCKRLIMLKKGKKVLEGSPQEIRNSFERNKVVVETDKDLSFVLNDRIQAYEKDGNFWTFYLADEDEGKEIFKKVSEQIGYVPSFTQAPPSLDEIFTIKVEEKDE